MTDHDQTEQIDIAAIRDEAARAERERIAGILDHPEAAGRQALARTLAFGTDMAPEVAASLMAVAAKDRPAFKSIAERALESPEPGADLGAPLTGRELAREEADARRQRVVQAAGGPDAAS